jgi:hypothetical protein
MFVIERLRRRPGGQIATAMSTCPHGAPAALDPLPALELEHALLALDERAQLRGILPRELEDRGLEHALGTVALGVVDVVGQVVRLHLWPALNH